MALLDFELALLNLIQTLENPNVERLIFIIAFRVFNY